MDHFLPEGSGSTFLGPLMEWIVSTDWPADDELFWAFILSVIEDEPGEYDDLPQWMTETASGLLQLNQ